MAEQFDVVIIGSGPAGRAAAKELVKAGWSVAMAEDYGFGGTCPLRGCEPKKVLVEAADTVARARDMEGHGLRRRPELDWPELARFNRSFVDPIPDRVESWLNQIEIATYSGFARFVGPNAVQVGGDVLEGRHFLIAAGAKPRPMDIPGAEYISSSDVFLKISHLPERILFVGGGFISFELGHIAARAGSEVTILEAGDRPLGPFDPDMVRLLVEATEAAGIEVLVNQPVKRLEKRGGHIAVVAGQDEAFFLADRVFHGAGRVPALDGLDLEKAGVDFSPRGVKVNEFMQSVSNPAVYAAGDAADTLPPLTPVADMEGRTAALNMLNGNRHQAVHFGHPSAVFTYPPLAAVGLTEPETQQKGLKYKKIFDRTAKWSEHKRIGMKHAGFKLLIDEAKDRLIGAHILGERAEEMINMFAFIMQNDLPVETLKTTIWAYPSFIYNIRYMLFR